MMKKPLKKISLKKTTVTLLNTKEKNNVQAGKLLSLAFTRCHTECTCPITV